MTHLQYFYEISKIPRPSGSEEKIAQYLCDFAKKHGLEYYTDENRNVLINKPASTGYENAPAFCLQGHTDMVCEKEISSTHDFTSDPIQIYEKDGKLSANGTTLGADDGAAIGIMLALLESTEPMPRLQCLFTAEEETGLFGAS
ncbi:MAG: M20/M25/M40 family metallo-hydrolase, partial [Clostridia bacterium]|nr:M20/M25/M40 family metallo-hydrolase [Clostridia bacterium]